MGVMYGQRVVFLTTHSAFVRNVQVCGVIYRALLRNLPGSFDATHTFVFVD